MPGLRLASATAITACTALKITREEMIRVMHEEHEFSDLFLKFLLARSMRIQADLVDQLFNSSEKRLARILLLMAEFGEPGEPETLIPKISQETLAEMIGTTRSRVSFFMNRFRKLGFLEYNGRIRVHKSLLKVILHDRMPDDNAFKPGVADAPRTRLQLGQIPAKRSILTSIANEALAYSRYTFSMALIGARMPDLKNSILIVEDEESVRTSLAMVLSVLGHRVRSASDGLAALIEMRQEAPDILLSDLNMPGMSGFELLSVVRRRFPAVRVIAMSGAFSGDQVPCGVTADAFYPKGYGVAILMRAIESLTTFEQAASRNARAHLDSEKRTRYQGRRVCNNRLPGLFQNVSAGDQLVLLT